MKKKLLNTLGSILLIGLPLHGREFVVTTTQDGTGPHNLRGAIIVANALGGRNTITLRQGTYQLGGYTALEITNGNLTIKGRRNTIIDASGLLGRGWLDNPVFHISSDARATFENLTITGGVGYRGGGINNRGQLVLNDCDISGNYSSGFGGGGINNSGNLAMFDCSVSGNYGGVGFGFSCDGGGIYNTGNLVINDCVISGNATQPGVDGDYFLSGWWLPIGFYPGFDGEDGGDGGGIYNAGNLVLNNSVIAGNACGSGGDGSDSINDNAGDGGNGGNGGGVFNLGTLVLNRCTVRNNSCGAGGNGGNETFDSSGTLIDGNGGTGGSGGGIYNAADGSDARLIRTSVRSNSAGLGGEPGTNGDYGLNGSGPDLFGNFTIHK